MDLVALGRIIEWAILFLLLGGILLLRFFGTKQHAKTGFYYLCGVLIIGLLAAVSAKTLEMNLLLIPINNGLNFFFLTHLYHPLSSTPKKVALGIAAIFTLAELISIGIALPTTQFFTYVSTALHAIIIGYTCTWYHRQLNLHKFFHFAPMFRLNTAVLLYFSTDLIIMLTINFLVNASISFVAPVWIFRQVTLTLFYSTLIYYLWHTGNNPKS